MQTHDRPEMIELTRLCHPGWPDRGPWWFFAHPTLVIERQRIIAATSFSVSIQPIGPSTLYGHDVLVHPDHQGKGIGSYLCNERVRIGREVGAQYFIGITWEDNTAMRRIFDRQGFAHVDTVLHVFPDGRAGMVYAGKIGGA